MRVSDEVKHCVAFIACDLGAGKTQYHGTGFFIGVPSEVEGFYVYLVTAKHVALVLDGLDVFIQAKYHNGDCDWKPYRVNTPHIKWHYHPDDDVDVAVAFMPPVVGLSGPMFTAPNLILNDQSLKKYGIGIGDEAIVSGLFTRLNETIEPIVRTGTIAMMPSGKMIWGEMYPGKHVLMDGYLIDQRSLGGMSGCPVFVRETVNVSGYKTEDGIDLPLNVLGRTFILGMMHGHWKIDPKKANDAFPNNGDFPIGLSIVIPAEKIMETLNQPSLKDQRDEHEDKLKSARGKRLGATATSNIGDANSKHKEDFNSLLDAAVKGRQ